MSAQPTTPAAALPPAAAASPITFASVWDTTAPPLVGEFWANEGGHHAGIVRDSAGKPLWHVVALPPLKVELRFGNYGGFVDGATDWNDGAANTLLLLNSGIAHPAAEACRAIETLLGVFDAYLAAPREARLIEANCKHLYPEDCIVWTSAQPEGDRHYAVVQDFARYGDQFWGYKYDEFLVCPVRRLVL